MASSSDRWRRIEALFYEALDLPPEARSAFLETNCAGDSDLRKEIETLLDSAGKPLEALQKPVLVAAQQVIVDPIMAHPMMAHPVAAHPVRASADDDPTSDGGAKGHDGTIPASTLLAHYEVISLLGAGGMGEVYLARDTRHAPPAQSRAQNAAPRTHRRRARSAPL